MTSINIAMVSGILGEQGPINAAGTGERVTNFTLLSEETRKEKGTARPRKHREWHRIAAYGELADFAASLKPQTLLLIQGRFKYNRRTVNGVPQHSVDIVADKIDILAPAAASGAKHG